jgi:hypothetical protein
MNLIALVSSRTQRARTETELGRSRKLGNRGEEELSRYSRLGEILLHNCSSMIPSFIS